LETPERKLQSLLVVYHRPFWRQPDGSLWEREGAFSRHIEALAPHFREVVLAAPLAPPAPDGHRVTATNVRLAALPFFDSLPTFYRALPALLVGLWRALKDVDIVNLRLPSPAGVWAFWLARLLGRPVFLLIVGDLAGVAASVPPTNTKRRLLRLYLRLEELLLQAMVRRALTITNGHALYEKYVRRGPCVFETQNSTVRACDVGRPRQSFALPRARLLCVSRVDPRKGIRHLPEALAVIRRRGFDASLEVIGPTVGRLGEEEKSATLASASRLGLAESIHFRGAASLGEAYAAYTEHDLLLLPSLPGEGIPRVLFEAMAAGLPVVATRVAGIPGVVESGRNGLLVCPADGVAMGEAAVRLLEDIGLRETCVAGGYATARQHTADAQAAWLADLLRAHFRLRASGTVPSPRRPVTPSPSRPVGPSPTASPRPRVTIPLAGLNLSGGVKSLLLLANYLVERGAAVRLLVPDYAAEAPVQLDPRVEVRVLPTRGSGRRRQLAHLSRLARGAAAEADVVLANYFLTAYPVVVSWLLHGRRAALAYNIRGYEPLSHGLMAPAGRLGRLVRFVLAWLSYRLPFAKIVTTEWLKRMVKDPHAIVVGHGIDLGTFQPRGTPDRRNTGPTVVGVIGRTGAVKGYPDFLKAAALLDEVGVQFLVAQSDSVPLPNGRCVEATHADTETEMAAFYNRCDVFVFPSLAEGFGLPALEAMACGCAVVTTDCGGVSAFARPEANCLMVPPGKPDLLAESIRRLVREPQTRARLASGGIETAQAFERNAALDRLGATILALANRSTAAPNA
jgi:glycosyltransferase involved in cell wall biosynthesis